MDFTNAYDRRLQLFQSHGVRADFLDRVSCVRDTMWLAQAAAESIFGEDVSPETVIAVYDRIAAHLGETPALMSPK